MAITRVDKAMLSGHAMDGLGPDHIRMPANPCGAVMQLELDESFRATSAKVRLRVCLCVCVCLRVFAWFVVCQQCRVAVWSGCVHWVLLCA
jgi:hypothetical protein